jgi:hypothetical protein
MRHLLLTPSYLSFYPTCFEGCWVCHGRFHDVLPKEHPGAFYEVPRGLYKGMSTNTHGQSDIVTDTTNI